MKINIITEQYIPKYVCHSFLKVEYAKYYGTFIQVRQRRHCFCSSRSIARTWTLVFFCYSRFLLVTETRVARRFIFKPKIPICVKFGGRWNGKFYYIVWPFGIFFGHLVYFMAVWYSLRSLGIFFLFWYVWTKKNLATLIETRRRL
jgi:hypothetical protein